MALSAGDEVKTRPVVLQPSAHAHDRMKRRWKKKKKAVMLAGHGWCCLVTEQRERGGLVPVGPAQRSKQCWVDVDRGAFA